MNFVDEPRENLVKDLVGTLVIGFSTKDGIVNQKTAKVLKRHAASYGQAGEGSQEVVARPEPQRARGRRPQDAIEACLATSSPSTHVDGRATTGGTRPPAWRTPHSTIARITGRRSSPFAVNAYCSRGGCSL